MTQCYIKITERDQLQKQREKLMASDCVKQLILENKLQMYPNSSALVASNSSNQQTCIMGSNSNRIRSYEWLSNPLQLQIEEYNANYDTDYENIAKRPNKTFNLNSNFKKRELKCNGKAKEKSKTNKKRSSNKPEGKMAILEQIKQKIDDSINEVKGLLEPSKSKFDLIFKQQFRGPQLQEDWMDWNLLNTGPKKDQNLSSKANNDAIQTRTQEYPIMMNQNTIRQLVQLLLKSPLKSLNFGPPVLCFTKEFFCDKCSWNNIDILQFDTAKSRDVHYQKVHQEYLCEFCGHSEYNTHRIASHKKQSLCIQENKSSQLGLQCLQQFQVTVLSNKIKKEEIPCSTCRKLENYSNPSALKIGQHLLIGHGEFRISQAQFFQLDLQRAFQALNQNDLSTLLENKFISLRTDGKYEKIISEQIGENFLLLMTYEGGLRTALNFCIQIENSSRTAIIYNYWTNNKYAFDLAIALTELKIHVEQKRVGKICIFVPRINSWYFERLNYQQTKESKIFQQLGAHYCNLDECELFFIRTQEYISSYIPISKTPIFNKTNEKSDLLRLLILQLKFNDIDKLLSRYLLTQLNASGKRQNQKALKNDQAITPKAIFNEIYERIRIHPYQMFDVCRFQKNWDASIHFNALEEEWPGEFVFVNPPFSVGSWFVTKIFLEFLKGKNIIVILPEISTESSFGSVLFRMLGSVHQLGIIKFGTHERKLRSPVSLIFLIQPDHIDYLKSIRKQNKNNVKMHEFSNPNSMACRKFLTREKEICISSMIDQQLTVREIQKCVGTSFSSISAIRKAKSSKQERISANIEVAKD